MKRPAVPLWQVEKDTAAAFWLSELVRGDTCGSEKAKVGVYLRTGVKKDR